MESTLDCQGADLNTLRVKPAERMLPLPVTFDSAVEQLARLPRMFVEQDGAFVWRPESNEETSWQVDGVLFDHPNQLQYAELKGRCPAARFQELLIVFGLPRQPLILQMVREGVFVESECFLEWLTGT